MWLSRQLQLYLAAICLGLARHLGKSTYASAITHGLVFAIALFGLDSLDTPTRFRRLGVAAVELKVGDQALVIDLFALLCAGCGASRMSPITPSSRFRFRLPRTSYPWRPIRSPLWAL